MIAQQIADIARQSAACTFYGGYAQLYDGRRVQFPQGVQEVETRNKDGRCTMARYIYADGSRLTFRWSKERGSTYEVTPAHITQVRAAGWYWTLPELVNDSASWTGPFDTEREALEHARTMDGDA